ncbi:MAG: hypothetical protein ABSD92_14410 [Candidatus Bathyarchaeia archaeon]|jgi:hypothetical protein
MAIKKKRLSSKALVAIILIVVLAIASAAIVYVATQSSSKPTEPGVHVGDTFTYSLMGNSILFSQDASTPAYLSEYNETNYYKVIITGVNGLVVSFNTIWQFTNGTEIQNADTIDLSTGNYSGDFWAIYPTNLNINNKLYPKEPNTELIVNNTGSQPYSSGNRTTDYWSIEKEFTDTNDPTHSTTMDNLIEVYFDKQTGMLDYLDNVLEYNNPEYNILITWQLTNSTAWGV